MPNNRVLKLEKTVSFSGLESFVNCRRFFEEKYINKTPYEYTIEYSLIVGSWAHELIEEKIRTNNTVNLEEELLIKVSDWLNNLRIQITQVEVEDIVKCVKELASLLYRASVLCIDRELSLRNKDNSVLKDPINYPSSSFLKALKGCEYYKFKSMIDMEASRQLNEFIDISLTWALADAYNLADSFKIPEWAYKTIGIELGFGTDKDTACYLDDSGISLLGFIDWVVELDDGNIVIIDHKTSKLTSKPTPLDVLYHPQLNLYASVFEKLTGRAVKYIGINHLRTGDIIIAEVDNHVKICNYEHILELFKESQNGKYIRRRPTDYMSPCIKKDIKSGRVINTCPYLNKCWPSYYESLEHGLIPKN
jgi:hypothetical protein